MEVALSGGSVPGKLDDSKGGSGQGSPAGGAALVLAESVVL
jgi:hypothetical protein